MRADRTSSTATLIAAATVFLARDRRICGLVSPEAETASALDVQIFECFVQAAVRAADGVYAAA